jgi:hypothetical protein
VSGRQVQQTDIVRQTQDATQLMPTGAIQQHDGVCARCDVAADLVQMQVHGLGIGVGQDQGRTNATRRQTAPKM